VKFSQYVASLHSHIFTNYCRRFILTFNKMALIFLGVLIVFNVSSFEFHKVKLTWLHRQWWVVPISSDLNPLDYQVLGERLESYFKLQPMVKQFPNLHCTLADLNCLAGESCRQRCERLLQVTAGMCVSVEILNI